MASPDPEWLLWREQYKSHSKSVAHQLHSLNQATSQIGDVTTRIADLAARSDFLQAQNDVLKQRVLSLEKDANQQDKLNEHLQADNHKFRDRIVHLEQDASQQDQINAMNSQAKGKLKEKLEKLKGDFVNVIEAVETMQKTTTAEREGQRKTVAGMRTRMEAFMATAPFNHPTSTGSELRNLASLFPTGESTAYPMA